MPTQFKTSAELKEFPRLKGSPDDHEGRHLFTEDGVYFCEARTIKAAQQIETAINTILPLTEAYEAALSKLSTRTIQRDHLNRGKQDVERERDKLKAQLSIYEDVCSGKPLDKIGEIVKLRVQVAELTKDKEMLEWAMAYPEKFSDLMFSVTVPNKDRQAAPSP